MRVRNIIVQITISHFVTIPTISIIGIVKNIMTTNTTIADTKKTIGSMVKNTMMTNITIADIMAADITMVDTTAADITMVDTTAVNIIGDKNYFRDRRG
jgi:hypothetical protein